MRRVAVLAVVMIVVGCSTAATPSASPSSASPPASTATAPAVSPSVPASAGTSPSPSPAAVEPRTWAEVAQGDIRPRAREDHTWTIDPAEPVAYLFGGRDGDRTFDDLWALDLRANEWRRLDPAGAAPPARFGHEAAWVAGVGLVLFAGQADASTFFADLWAYDPAANSWRDLPSEGDRPVPRYGTCSGVGPDGRLWISHGFTEDRARFADTKAYDFATGRWTDVTPAGKLPVERCLHACWWTPGGQFVLYAGQTTGVEALDDLWVLRGAGTPSAAWFRSDAPLPPARNLYGQAVRGDESYVFGGRGDGRFRDDLWRFAGDLAPERVEIADPPPGRSGAALVTEPGGNVLMFGGKNADGALDDLWSLEFE